MRCILDNRNISGDFAQSVHVDGSPSIVDGNDRAGVRTNFASEVIQINAYVIYTGNTSIHIAVDVYSRDIGQKEFEKKTHCVIVFVSVDEKGKPIPVKKWEPQTEREIKLAGYAQKLTSLREQISDEMKPFFEE